MLVQVGSDVFPLQTVDVPYLLLLLFPGIGLCVPPEGHQTASCALELLADDSVNESCR